MENMPWQQNNSFKDDYILDENNDTTFIDEDGLLIWNLPFDASLIVFGVFILLNNGLVIVLVCKVRNLRTITNQFLVSLATADLLAGVLGIPLFVGCSVTGGVYLCCISAVFNRFTSISTVLHLVVITLDRYVAIRSSLMYPIIFNKRMSTTLITMAWGVSLGVSSVMFRFFSFLLEETEEGDAKFKESIFVYNYVCLALFFVLPLLGMAYAYMIILITARNHMKRITKRANSVDLNETETLRARHDKHRKTLYIYITMIVTFTLCWLTFYLLGIDSESDGKVLNLPIWAQNMICFFRFFTSFLNPILYTFWKYDFKMALRCLLLSNREYEYGSTNTVPHSTAA